MAIPFYENEEHLHQQQQSSEETDQVDGPVIQTPNVPAQHQGLNSPANNIHTEGSYPTNPGSPNQQGFMAWKILAVAMCKALKDHYQQNMATSSSTSNSAAFANNNNASTLDEPLAAVIQILPNGQVKPQWN